VNDNIFSSVKAKLQRLKQQLPYVPQAWQLIWTAARRWTIAWVCILFVQGFLPVASVYLMRDVVDQLSHSIKGNAGLDVRKTLGLVVALAVVFLLGEMLNSLAKWVRSAQAERVQDHISGLIHAKAVGLDLAFFDLPDYYDRLYRAQNDALNRPVALLENVGDLLQSGLTFIAMAGVLLAFGWWVPVILVAGVLPALIVVVHSTLREHEWRQRNTAAHRSARYYDWLLIDQEAAAELRLFSLGDHFRQVYQTIRARLRDEHFTILRKQAMSELVASGLALTITGGVMGWMVLQAGAGLLSLGNLALFYQAFSQGQRLMHTLLGSVAQIYSNILFLENLFEFLQLKAKLITPDAPVPMPENLQKGVTFQQVAFKYPGSERLALSNFNLTIPAGQVAAIVGENGAGKSTLIKLLCRFYDPEDGVVMVDDIDLRMMTPEKLREQITVLFQQPVNYYGTVADNISLGDLASQPTAENIENAAQAAGAASIINRLPEQYETMLGKWFGGSELSGGEWQRIALARAFLRKAPIIILDEPTSAMDSWAEADWMARFRSLVTGRTALIITHRFTTAMQADIIHVMAEGRVVESGTHHELLKCDGRYAQSWRQQTREKHDKPTP
jgi:ATP-binding cassette, subfamily B, bacterial